MVSGANVVRQTITFGSNSSRRTTKTRFCFCFFPCLATGIIWVIIPLEWGSPLKIFSCTCLSRWYINCLRFFSIFYLIRCSRRRGGESWTPHQEAVDRTHAILRCERKWFWFYHEWHSYIKTSREKQLFDKEKPHRLVAESEVLLGVDYVVVLLFSFGCLFVFKFYVNCWSLSALDHILIINFSLYKY